jgi:sec-independent protein translocase protein TatA
MGPLGTQELVFIFILALLLFGPKELPKIGKTIGKAMIEFRRAQTELKSTFDREMKNLERETGIQELAATTFKADNYTYNPYESEYFDGDYGSPPPETYTSTDGAFAPQSAEPTAPLQIEAAAGSIASGHLEASHPAAPASPVADPAHAVNSHAEAVTVPAEAAPKTA